MSMPHKPLSRKAPDGLLQISDRVYVFDSCLTLEYDWSEERYKGYMDRVVGEFGEKVHDASIMVCNFREEKTNTKISKNFCKHNVTVIDYPGRHHGCPVPKMETIHQFLKLCENWLSHGEHNVLLMHCEHGGGWPVLAFMLAALLTFRKQYDGEEKALDMVYKQAPRELLHLMMPLDPIPSQLRYLQYVSSWNVALDWPPLDRALRLDCIILRYIPNFDGKGGCHPMFRIYGQDPALADKSSKILYSMPKRAKNVRAYKQGEYELIIVDINCHVQGDVLIESINLNDDMESEQMMFHAMFNTAFLRSNILMLNRDKVDVLWDAKDHFPKDFRAEILFSEIDTAAAVPENGTSWFEDKEGLPVEAFSKAQEIFSDGDWMSPREDPALQQRRASDIIHGKLDTSSDQYVESGTILHQTGPKMPQEKKNEANSFLPSNLEVQSLSSTKQTPDNGMNRKEDKTIKVDATPSRPSCSDSIIFLHQTGSKMLQEKKNEANYLFSSNLEVQSVSSNRQTPDNGMNRKEDKSIKVDTISPQPSCSDSQTGPKMPQEKKSDANCFLPSNLEIKSVSSTKQTPNNDMRIKEDKTVKVDATPPRPSCSDSTTFSHQTGPKMPQEKMNEENCFLLSNLEIQSVSSTKKTPNNDMSRKEDQTIKVDATPSRRGCFDSQTGPKMPQEKKSDANCLPSNLGIQSVSSTKQTPDNGMSRKEDKTIKVERTSEFSNCVTDSKNLNSKQHSSDLSLPGFVDTSPSGSISPQTPPLRAKEVHDSPPHMVSNPHHVLPLKLRNSVTEETESQSQDRSQSSKFSTKTGTPFSSTFQNKSQADAASHTPASATQPPLKKILPVRTRPDSSLSKTQTPLSPHTPPLKEHEPIRARPPPSPPTPPPKDETHLKAGSPLSPQTPPQPPCLYGKAASPTIAPPPPPPPPSAELSSNDPNSSLHKSPLVPAAPAIPPPPAPISDNGFPVSLSVGGDGNNMSGTEGHRSSSSTGSKGRILTHTMSSKNNTKKLKPLHWLKISRVVKGSLWDETQKSGEASKAPEIDMSELESLFSAAVPSKGPAKKSKVQSSVAPKSDKVQLIDHTRAYNCEILLSKVKVPLQDLMSSVLALEESALDTDQVENLIKFCPTKEEIEVLKGYTGEKEKLGRCEQFFLELMKVPRVESKLRVFSFKIQFHSQVSDLRNNLHVVNAASEEIRNSVKLRRIMQTILSLGNALNQGTAKGSAIGFRLDSLLKLTETRSRNNKITLVHYLCKVLADKLPEVLDFSKDLANLEPAAKIQLKFLAEEMQAIRKGLEKVKHEQSSSEDDGPISEPFCKNLKEFLCSAEVEVSSLASLYSVVGGNMDALIIYFGEDPSRCPFEQVVTTLLNFTGMFNKAHEENCNQLELEMKKTEESETKK